MKTLAIFPRGVRFEGCSLITGFHGIGATGYWTVKYLVQKLKMSRVAYVDSPYAAPVCGTSEGSLVTPYEFYKQGNLVLFKMEVPPYKGTELRFFRALCNWITKAGFKETALIGGLDSSLKTDESNFRFVHTAAYKRKGEFKEASILEEGHAIVGPVATMLNSFEIRGFPAYAVLSYAATERVDPRAAAEAITILSKQYQFDVDTEPLIKGAEALESEVTKQHLEVKRDTDSIYT